MLPAQSQRWGQGQPEGRANSFLPGASPSTLSLPPPRLPDKASFIKTVAAFFGDTWGQRRGPGVTGKPCCPTAVCSLPTPHPPHRPPWGLPASLPPELWRVSQGRIVSCNQSVIRLSAASQPQEPRLSACKPDGCLKGPYAKHSERAAGREVGTAVFHFKPFLQFSGPQRFAQAVSLARSVPPYLSPTSVTILHSSRQPTMTAG